MSESVARHPDLTHYRVLSFDCYGTLIDWETGIAAVLGAWSRDQGLSCSADELLGVYGGHEAAIEQERPADRYPEILANAFRRTGDTLGKPVSDRWAERLGHSVQYWPAFSDSAYALARLADHYRLVIVSNVHRAGFAASNEHLRGEFAAVITAEDVGAYKPADSHFRALDATIEELGAGRDELLHVAQSLFHDHVPARRNGLASVWINRRGGRPGWGATPEPTAEFSYGLEFASMADFADAVDRAFDRAFDEAFDRARPGQAS
ncbi:MAG: HAD-IA family hydrolase [Nocardioides sp.]